MSQIYRWVDQDGQVHYSDQIPPSHSSRGHTRINDTGIAVEVVPPAKTPEEWRREQDLERLRQRQQRLLEEQAAADNLLLRSYGSIGDIEAARNNNLATIDAAILVTRNEIRRQQEALTGLYTEAADLERAGRTVPDTLGGRILQLETAIHDAYARILEREQQKQQIRESFARDIQRFQELRGLAQWRDEVPVEPAETTTSPALPNLVVCADQAECERLWHLAVAYVHRHATTPVHVSADNLLATAAPRGPNDVSLILSRLPAPTGQGASQLFLDLQCAASPQGASACDATKAGPILEGFQRALERP